MKPEPIKFTVDQIRNFVGLGFTDVPSQMLAALMEHYDVANSEKPEDNEIRIIKDRGVTIEFPNPKDYELCQTDEGIVVPRDRIAVKYTIKYLKRWDANKLNAAILYKSGQQITGISTHDFNRNTPPMLVLKINYDQPTNQPI